MDVRSIQKAKFDELMRKFDAAQKSCGGRWDNPVFGVVHYANWDEFMTVEPEDAKNITGSVEEIVAYIEKVGYNYGQALSLAASALAECLAYDCEIDEDDERMEDFWQAQKLNYASCCGSCAVKRGGDICITYLEGIPVEIERYNWNSERQKEERWTSVNVLDLFKVEMTEDAIRAAQKAAFDDVLADIKSVYEERGNTWGDPGYNVAKWDDANDYMEDWFDSAKVKSGTAEEVVSFLQDQGFAYSEALTMVACAAVARINDLNTPSRFIGYVNVLSDMLFGGMSIDGQRAIYSVALDGMDEQIPDADIVSEIYPHDVSRYDLFKHINHYE